MSEETPVVKPLRWEEDMQLFSRFLDRKVTLLAIYSCLGFFCMPLIDIQCANFIDFLVGVSNAWLFTDRSFAFAIVILTN